MENKGSALSEEKTKFLNHQSQVPTNQIHQHFLQFSGISLTVRQATTTWGE
jgi:hypothetical protein